MFAKRGLIRLFERVSERYLLLLVLALFLVPVSVNAETGLECDLATQNTLPQCGGASIYTPGYGAVELCQVCYQCGEGDGVCPEEYSDGQSETSLEKLTFMMRVKRTVFFGDQYSVAFKTGNDACATVAGTCDHIERSSDAISWNTVPSCALDVSANVITNNEYFRAVCKDVPRKAGCEHCPDPDCITKLSGMTYSGLDGSMLSDVTISIGESGNTNLVVIPDGISDYNGLYEMDAVTGYINITCSKAGYSDYLVTKYVKQGRNIVDCKMSEIGISCTPECYFVDAYGNYVCSAACDGQNGCNMTELAKTSCDGLPYGHTAYLNTTMFVDSTTGCSYENVSTLNCCQGDITTQILSIFAPGGCGTGSVIITDPEYVLYNEGNLSNMLTRNYKKEINGRSITLSIRTYTK
jgi:hypothetical protein